MGLNVKLISLTSENFENKECMLATDFTPLISELESRDYDIVLVEYPSLISNNIPSGLLLNANLNLFIVNAKRVWRKSDGKILKHLETSAENTPLKLILNNADRYDVEDYVGELPPVKSHRSVALRLMHMGLTSSKSKID